MGLHLRIKVFKRCLIWLWRFSFALDTEAVTGYNPKTDERKSRKPSSDEPFAALAFKIATDPFVGRLCLQELIQELLHAGSYVLNTRTGNKERISRIFQMHANKQNPILN